MKWQRATQVMLASAALSAPPLQAADQSGLDADFLEFLGTIDAEAAGWGEYLERTEIVTVAATPVAKASAAKAPVPVPVPKPTPAARQPASKPPKSLSK